MKIIFVTPHLSTGGMPEYLRRKVELLKDDHEVWVVEKHFEAAYRTIRDKIESLIGERLVNIGDNHYRLLQIIKDVKPDVVHFEELSDYHFREKLLDQIYTEDREYLIFDTLHDSSIDHTEKRYMPDKMLVVSPWQVKNFMDLGIPVEMLEHEIIHGKRDRSGLECLGLDPNKKHVVQVGLFSRRKNQGETIELARSMPDVEFHLVGSQTDNFSDYWKPLLNNLPSNCRVWGERSDVYTFYSCMDCVIFPSRGEYGDRETNPLVIREAMAWGIPLFVRDRDFYMGMYSESATVRFMHDDKNANAEELRRFLGVNQNPSKIENQHMENQPISKDFFKKKLFEITFDRESNKINFMYLEQPTLDAYICVRDIDTEVPIYSFDACFQPGSEVWCIPIPKQYYDFQENPNFGGFMYDFYVNGERRYTMTTRIKTAAQKKPRFRIESMDPLFVNYEQFFTEKIYDQFFERIGEIDNVLDIGANVGLFTELAIRKGAKKIIAAEINPNAISTFSSIHNGKREGAQVNLISKAISKEDGTLTIYNNPDNSLVGSIFSDLTYYGRTDDLSETYDVDSIGIDTLFGKSKLQFNNVSLLKIDVEGSEYDIFDGFSINNLKKVESIIMEFHNNYGGRLRDSIISKLEGAGFEYEIYQDNCQDFASEWEERGTIFAKRNK